MPTGIFNWKTNLQVNILFPVPHQISTCSILIHTQETDWAVSLMNAKSMYFGVHIASFEADSSLHHTKKHLPLSGYPQSFPPARLSKLIWATV